MNKLNKLLAFALMMLAVNAFGVDYRRVIDGKVYDLVEIRKLREENKKLKAAGLVEKPDPYVRWEIVNGTTVAELPEGLVRKVTTGAGEQYFILIQNPTHGPNGVGAAMAYNRKTTRTVRVGGSLVSCRLYDAGTIPKE